MSSADKNHAQQSSMSESEIVDYLIANPDFLFRRPDVIGSLTIPHETGGAVSLVERQVQSLREQVAQYRQQLENLILVARENDDLNKRLHVLTLTLINARDFDDMVSGLQDELRNLFHCDAVQLKLFDEEALEKSNELGAKLFADFINLQQPSCASLNEAQLDFLFDDVAHHAGSAALIPIRGNDEVGILAIGSHDADRFTEHQGIDFLQRLGDLVSATLMRLPKRS